MSTDFGSTSYAGAFANLPEPDVAMLRASTLAYLDKFDKEKWYNEPITSILKGKKLSVVREELVETKDAFGNANGLQQFASKSDLLLLKGHIRNFQSPFQDLRTPLRKIEQELLTTYSGELIGNQCVDFGKQDGITEMEEATMANAVERNLNDALLRDEAEGRVAIQRRTIFVGCVSNFTNFLDLFRKTIRSLELGIPCVILGRSNTSQHSYRWTELIVKLLKEQEESGVDYTSLLTYLSCPLRDIIDITQSSQDVTGNLYTTCSRALALEIKSGYANTIASTGGPNTLVTTEWTEEIRQAIRMSARIESSGQCTALRHCVVPKSLTPNELEAVFSDQGVTLESAPEAVRRGMFDGIFSGHGGSCVPESGYQHLKDYDTYVRSDTTLPADGINEYWRRIVVDFSRMEDQWESDDAELNAVARWLNTNQPISLAMNSTRSHHRSFDLGLALFERTGLVVYTVGSTDDPAAPPALTCQARPQEGEIFGEFPPRGSLEEYTKYPVVVPSSTPSYDAYYRAEYLESLTLSEGIPKRIEELLTLVQLPALRGYCAALLNYLEDATLENPKRGCGTSRTALWGLQRPPVLSGLKTCLRCSETTTFDALAPPLLIFFATNARDQFELSVDPNNAELLGVCEKFDIPVLVQTQKEFSVRDRDSMHNVIQVLHGLSEFPLAGNYVSLYFPCGHIKSTKPDDVEFVERFRRSSKWLQLAP